MSKDSYHLRPLHPCKYSTPWLLQHKFPKGEQHLPQSAKCSGLRGCGSTPGFAFHETERHRPPTPKRESRRGKGTPPRQETHRQRRGKERPCRTQSLGTRHRPRLPQPLLTSKAGCSAAGGRKCVTRPRPSLSRSSFAPSRRCSGPAPCNRSPGTPKHGTLLPDAGRNEEAVAPRGELGKTRMRRALGPNQGWRRGFVS